MAFKTFVAIRLAHSICTGKPFAGREVFHQGKVLMACGEGQGALSRRIKALRIVEGGFNNNLLVLNEPVRIDNKADMARLRLAIDEFKPALFIFDTFANLVSETDENSPSDTGRALRLIKETVPTVHICEECFAAYSKAEHPKQCPECGAETLVERKAIKTVEVELKELQRADLQREQRKAFVKAERKNCQTLEDFLNLALKVGYQSGWAYKQWDMRCAWMKSKGYLVPTVTA